MNLLDTSIARESMGQIMHNVCTAAFTGGSVLVFHPRSLSDIFYGGMLYIIFVLLFLAGVRLKNGGAS